MKTIERSSNMPEAMLQVRGNILPFEILKKMSATVYDSFTITKNDTGEDLPYPPEEDFRPEFVAEVEKSCKEYHAGKRDDFIICKSQEEQETLFNKIWNEDE